MLVDREFISSFPQDATEFDDARLPTIVKTFYNKALTVSFGPNDVVSEVEYVSNGEK